jgi:filamentous hemagglutinin
MTTIKITQLPSIGNGLSASTILPVVNTSGTAVTEKVTVGAVANYVLTQAGNTLSPAFLSTIAYSVSNSSQPNITSVGTLSVDTLKITGGIVGYYLQTDGSGNLAWAPGGGGNGAVGGINTQVQFNDEGNFSGNTGFTFNKTTGVFTSPFLAGNGNGLSNIQGANVSGFVPNANVANTALAVAAANVSGLGNIATINLTGSNSNVLYGNGVFAPASGGNSTYDNSNVATFLAAFGSNTITTTGNISGGNLVTGGQVVASGNVSSGTGLSTGGFLSVDGTADLHDTTVTGYANVTGTANTVGGGATVGVRSILAIDSAFGSNSSADPASAQAVRGRVTGSNLTKTRNYVAGVTGQYLVTGTNASEFINTGLLGVVGDQTTTANAAVVAYLDGDGGLTTAGSAYGVSMKNSTPGSGFDYGLDLQFIDLNVAGTTTPFKQADIRFNNGVELVANTANNISINADVTVGNITATNLGNIATVNLTGSNSNVLYGNGVFAAVAGGGGLPLANGSSNFNIATSGGNVTIDVAGLETWTFDTNGNLTIPGSIVGTATIDIDNRASGNGADINLYSADDILIQARDRDAGSTAEGGDINIFAGDSAEDSDASGGDIVIEAGRGGAANLDFGGDGGFVRVEAGQGGAAVGANISARSGGSLTLNAGNGGTNNGNIDLGNSGGDVTINAGDSTGNGDPGGSIILRSGDAGANALAGQIQLIIPGGDVGPGGTWIFDGNGIIQLPNSGTISNEGNNIDIGSTSAISLEASSAVNIYTDTGTNAWQWQFQDDGNLRLPTIELDVGNTINEQTVIQSQRKIIPGLRYSAEITGSTPTTVYTATSVDTTSMKVTMQIQHSGLGFEFFDVSATSTGGNTYYTVSNRLQPPTIADSTVVVDLNGSNFMDITVTINSGAANSWVTYDATEFGIAVD